MVDALAPGLDLAPLGALLADTAVTKVFHAARQDVEIFLLRFGAVPTPILRHPDRRHGRRLRRPGEL